MNAQLRSEIKKMVTTRLAWMLAAAAVAIAIVTAIAGGTQAFPVGDPLHSPAVLRMPLFVGIVILVMGIRTFTDEFRYGTVDATLLASGRRGRVVAAKAIVAAGAGAIIAALAEIVVVAASAAIASMKGEPVTIDMARLAWIGGGVVATGAAFGALGAGFGAAVRHQVAAVVSGILWFLLGEELLSIPLREAAKYLPSAAAQGGSHAALGPGLDPATSLAVFAAYALVAVGAGALAMRRRDIA